MVIEEYCERCKQARPFEKDSVNHLLHFVLTFFSFGLYGFVWIILIVANSRKQYRCRFCALAFKKEEKYIDFYWGEKKISIGRNTMLVFLYLLLCVIIKIFLD